MTNEKDRKSELLEVIEENSTLIPLIDEMVYLEEQLDHLRSLPKIKVHPKDPSIQKVTPAAKLYKELLQQYTNIIRIIMRVTGEDETQEESPLRAWVRKHADLKKENLDT